MRCRLAALILGLLLPGLPSPLRAERVRVEGVEGQVLYGEGDRVPSMPVKAGEVLPAGTFSAAQNGVLYLSTFSGSELRLAEAGTLHFLGIEEPCPTERGTGRHSVFRLLRGKLRVTIRPTEKPPRCYRIVLPRGYARVEWGQCVMCLHGEGTFVYVARGVTMLAGSVEPLSHPVEAGAAPLTPVRRTEVTIQKPARLTGNGDVGVLDIHGRVRIVPLSSLGASTQTCLLAGFRPDAAGAPGKKNNVDASRRPFAPDPGTASIPIFHRFIVSPIQ